MNGPKTEKIEKMFNSIAPDYDRLNHLLSLDVDRSWRRRAIKEVLSVGLYDTFATMTASKRGITENIQAPLEVLDIACGTGDFSIALAKGAARKKRPIRITGLDLSEGMLGVMKQKVEAEGLGETITTMLGNSEKMPFADGSFDVVSISFGIRNFEHREVALCEILRVLKPGGRLVILELSVPANPVVRWGYFLYFNNILPRIGGKISGDRSAYNYLPASVLKFPSKDEWMATMASCGYSSVTHKSFTFGICRLYTGTKI